MDMFYAFVIKNYVHQKILQMLALLPMQVAHSCGVGATWQYD